MKLKCFFLLATFLGLHSKASKEGLIIFIASTSYFSALALYAGHQVREFKKNKIRDQLRKRKSASFQRKCPQAFEEAVNLQYEIECEMEQWRKDNPSLVRVCRVFDKNFTEPKAR